MGGEGGLPARVRVATSGESRLHASRPCRVIIKKGAAIVRHRGRFFAALGSATVVVFAVVGVVSADISSKTINTTNGECVNSGDPPTLGDGTTPCGAAVYGPNGFSGTIHATGDETIVDYICVHLPGNGPFTSYGGAYTLTLYDSGNAVIGTTSETVTAGIECTDGLTQNAVTSGSINLDFDAYGGVVKYSVSIVGVTPANAQNTFSAYNSIRNGALDLLNGTHANSPSVAPPGPPGEIPEAPAAILLVASAGLVTMLFVGRRRVAATLRRG